MKLDNKNKIALIKFLLLVIALVNLALLSSAQASPVFNAENKHNRLMERAIFALEEVLNYYKHNYDTINIDSLLGVRVAEGILRKISIDADGKAKSGKTKPFSLIRKMYINVRDISERSLPIVRDNNMQAFQMFHNIISKPWQLLKQFRKLNKKNGKKKPLKNVIFDGPTSDYCISLLIGDRNGYVSCNITDFCWQFETQKDVDGYTPTHQVLYFLLGLEQGCESAFNRKFQETVLKKNSVQDFLREICGNILQTADELWKDSNLLEIEKDLFMEQTLVCSLAGYEDFLNERYFDMILGWQTNVGCFGVQTSAIQGKGTTRKLQYTEELFENGCMNHETGVAVALLAQYVRWILDTTMW